MILRPVQLLFLITAIIAAGAVGAQPTVTQKVAAIQVCPGAFPTDLTARDCSYTTRQRTLDFVSSSVSDQSLLGALVFGFGAQVIKSPPEWGRNWDGYGRRVGSRYSQAIGKGAAQYVFGLMLKDDPRFLAYHSDAAVLARHRDAVCALAARMSIGAQESCVNPSAESLDAFAHDGWKRFDHAWFDVVTVRRSSVQGHGHRIPAISRFAAELGGAYAGFPWYPGAENSAGKVGQRAAGALGTAVLSSFYCEYKPEITNVLGALFRRGSQPKSGTGGNQ